MLVSFILYKIFMEIIKLGDKVTIPGKNIRGEVAFIGETHFSDGTWFGIILDNPNGKHNGTIDGKRYFNCPSNHGMFIKTSYFEKEYNNIYNTKTLSTIQHTITTRRFIRKRSKHPNFLKTSFKQKATSNMCTSQSINSRKIKQVSIKNRKLGVPCGDNSINKENTKISAIAECGDNSESSDAKMILALKRYPNYLKASSKLARNHFCANLKKCTKTDNETIVGDQVANKYEKRLMLPENYDIDENGNKIYKRIIYPNYLKASSKLTAKRLCMEKSKNDNKTDYEVIEDVGNKTSPKKSMEVQIQNKCEENNDIFDNSASKVIKYQRPFSSFERSRSYSAKFIETGKVNFHSKNKVTDMSNDKHIQDIIDKNMELEEIKRENKNLKDKLESIEVSLQEALDKYNKAQEEIKHLKYDNECQRKQIKYQKSHMKLLKMTQINNFKKNPNQNKISRPLKSTLNEHVHNDTKNLDEKLDPERIKTMISTNRISELEEQNSVMVKGLLELRDFLKMQCESQFIGLESSCPNKYNHSLQKKDKTDTFSYYNTSPNVSKAKAFTTDQSQLNEYSEMLREMTKYNEFIKEDEKYLNGCGRINLDAGFLGDSDSPQKRYDSHNIIHEVVETFESPFDDNRKNYIDPLSAKLNNEPVETSYSLKKTGVQSDHHTAVKQSPQYLHNVTTKNNKYYEQHGDNGVSHELSDNSRELITQFSTKELNENTAVSNIPKQDTLEKEVSVKNSNSVKS